MDTVEFEKYLNANILPLYLDASDILGKRLETIVDSGPGIANTHLIAEIRIQGFYLIPGLLSTTHVTQATDNKYGQKLSR